MYTGCTAFCLIETPILNGTAGQVPQHQPLEFSARDIKQISRLQPACLDYASDAFQTDIVRGPVVKNIVRIGGVKQTNLRIARCEMSQDEPVQLRLAVPALTQPAALGGGRHVA